MMAVPTGPRQFTLMAPGGTFQNSNTLPPWQHVSSTGGPTYYHETYCDLRGMIGVESKSQGLSILSANLQEATDVYVPGEKYVYVYDILTTVPLSTATISKIGHALATSPDSETPGFLKNAELTYLGDDPDEQTLNPSQVVWGMWRLFAGNTAYRLGLDTATQVIQSGIFGQGEIVTSAGLYYTRIAIANAEATAINIPSANLAVWGAVAPITEAEEMTSMMRAYQR